MAECLKNTALLLDEELGYGTLSNGLKYYIRKNTFPETESFLGLVVNIGSMEEEEYEKGIAHFVEHVSLREYESNNKDIQMAGYTNFNHTCYLIKCVSQNLDIIEDALLKLKGIAKDVKFYTESICKERQIINEEFKSVNDEIHSKLRNRVLEVILNNSRYSKRIPICEDSSVNNIEQRELINFYSKWYGINNMAIIAVGNFDSHKIEREIKKNFSDIKKYKNISVPEYFIPDFEEVKVMYNSYEEIDNLEMNFYFKKSRQAVKNIHDFRTNIVENLVLNLITNFIKIYSRNEAIYYNKQFSKDNVFTAISVKLNQGNIENQVENILQSIAMVMGSNTSKEIHYVKQSFFQVVKSNYEQKNKINSKIFFYECVRNFTVGEPIISIENEFILIDSLINEITTDEIINYAIEFLNNKNLAIAFNLNKKVKFDSEEVLSLIKKCEFIGNVKTTLWDNH